MPAVKPVTTGWGMYFDPSTSAASARRRSASARPSPSPAPTRRSRGAGSRRTRPPTKAPVGPPIWNRLPPRAEIRKPATYRRHQSRLRRCTRGDGQRHRQRQGDDRDGEAGQRVGAKRPPGHNPGAARSRSLGTKRCHPSPDGRSVPKPTGGRFPFRNGRRGRPAAAGSGGSTLAQGGKRVPSAVASCRPCAASAIRLGLAAGLHGPMMGCRSNRFIAVRG